MLNIDRPYSISRKTTIEVMIVRFSQNRGYLKALRDPLRLPTSVIENETEETFSSVSRQICSLSKDTVSAAVVELYTQNSSLECFFLLFLTVFWLFFTFFRVFLTFSWLILTFPFGYS